MTDSKKKHPEGAPATASSPTKTIITWGDALQYIKELEAENVALHDQKNALMRSNGRLSKAATEYRNAATSRAEALDEIAKLGIVLSDLICHGGDALPHLRDAVTKAEAAVNRPMPWAPGWSSAIQSAGQDGPSPEAEPAYTYDAEVFRTYLAIMMANQITCFNQLADELARRNDMNLGAIYRTYAYSLQTMLLKLPNGPIGKVPVMPEQEDPSTAKSGLKPKQSIGEDQFHDVAKAASLGVAKNANIAPQLCYAPILWALQDEVGIGNTINPIPPGFDADTPPSDRITRYTAVLRQIHLDEHLVARIIEAIDRSDRLEAALTPPAETKENLQE